jgi:hypothetical protein
MDLPELARLTPAATVCDVANLLRAIPQRVTAARTTLQPWYVANRLERTLERDVTPDGWVRVPIDMLLDVGEVLVAAMDRYPQARRAAHQLLVVA